MTILIIQHSLTNYIERERERLDTCMYVCMYVLNRDICNAKTRLIVVLLYYEVVFGPYVI